MTARPFGPGRSSWPWVSPGPSWGVPGEKDFLGKGVSYCASCDAGFFKGRPVAVIGEESEAAESAVLMTEYASKVYWVHRQLKVSPQMVEKVKRTIGGDDRG